MLLYINGRQTFSIVAQITLLIAIESPPRLKPLRQND